MVEINFDKLDRTLVLAELSCNHLQSFDIAVRTIEAMKKAGADVVKVQNIRVENYFREGNIHALGVVAQIAESCP